MRTVFSQKIIVAYKKACQVTNPNWYNGFCHGWAKSSADSKLERGKIKIWMQVICRTLYQYEITKCPDTKCYARNTFWKYIGKR